MLDQHDRDALRLQMLEHQGEFGQFALGQSGGGLVEQDHARTGEQNARQLGHPLVAIGQVAHDRIGKCRQAGHFNDAIGGGEHLRLFAQCARPVERRGDLVLPVEPMRAQHHVLAHGKPRHQARVLESPDDAGLRDTIIRKSRDVAALEDDATGIRAIDAADDIDQRALARAVRADQSEDMAGLQFQRHIVERAQTQKADRQAFDAQQWQRRGSPRRYGPRRFGHGAFAGSGARRGEAFDELRAGQHEPREATGKQHERKQQQQSVDHELVIGKKLQLLGQVGEEYRPEHGPGQRAQSADYRHDQGFDRTMQVECLGSQISDQMGVEAASQAGQRSAQRVGFALGAGARDADTAGRHLGNMDRKKRPPERTGDEVAQQPKHDCGDDQHQLEVADRTHLHPEHAQRAQRRRRHAAQPRNAPGHRSPFADDFVEDHAEAQGHHRQVELAHATRGERQQPACRGAHQGPGQQRQR